MSRLIGMIFVADLIACRVHVFMSAVACNSSRPVISRLWSGFLVWLLLEMMHVAFSWTGWRVFRCPSKRGVSSLCCSCAFSACWIGEGVTRGYKDGLQPESLADGSWLVKQNQPVSKIETKSDTNLRSLYES